jgi:hypothetical protein
MQVICAHLDVHLVEALNPARESLMEALDLPTSAFLDSLAAKRRETIHPTPTIDRRWSRIKMREVARGYVSREYVAAWRRFSRYTRNHVLILFSMFGWSE